MFGISPKKVFLACAASAVIAHSNLTHRCSASDQHKGAQEAASSSGVSSEFGGNQILSPPSLLESKNPASQVASLNHKKQVRNPSSSGASGAQQEAEPNSAASSPLRGTQQPESADEGFLGRHSEEKAAPTRQLGTTLDEPEIPSEHVFPYSAPAPSMNSVLNEQASPPDHAVPYSTDSLPLPPRRLQLLGGLSQLTQPLSVFANFFGDGLSARDRDQFETYTRRVLTSRERVYKDLIFVTGARFHGLDEYAMKQLVAKVGLETFASGSIPPNVQLSPQESAVLDAAKRSRFQIDRIGDTYEREVAGHARTLRQQLQADSSQPSIQQKIESIATNGIFRKRHLKQLSRIRRLAALLQGPGLLGTAGSLIRSIDPSNLTNSLNAGLGGLGVHHLRLPNIGGLGIGHDGRAPEPGLEDANALQEALTNIFPLPQQATAIAGPLRSFQQGVSTATEGAIGAFLSKEELVPFLSVDTMKQLLGSLIGGEAIGADGFFGWESLGLSPAAVQGLTAKMPFDSFLSKLGILAQEVDSDVGTLRRETKRRIGAGGFPVQADQLLKIDNLLDRLVWGALHPPQRRLQQLENDNNALPQQQQQQQQEEATQPQQPHQQEQQQEATQPQQPHQQEQQQEATQPQQPQQQQEASQPQQPQQPQEPQQQQTVEAEPQAPPKQPLTPEPQEQTPDAAQQQQAPEQQPEQQQQPSAAQQQQQQPPNNPQQQQQQQEPPNTPQQQQQLPVKDEDSVEDLFEALVEEEIWEKYDPEEKMNAALQRVELLADAVTVLLKEYEKAVEFLQRLLEEQVQVAEDIRDELEDQMDNIKKQVNKAQKKQQQQKQQQQKQQKQQQQQQEQPERAAAAAQLARAYDEAMEGLKDSLEGLLQQQQQQNVPDAVLQQLGPLAAKIEAAAEEKLPPAVGAH